MKKLNKNKLLLAFLLLVPVYASATNINSTDPFIQEWDYFDGINTYKLTITPSAAPGQTYHIDYTFPGGRASTDMCTTTSNTSFTCMTGETISRDDLTHSIKISSRDTNYVFYDPKYMPAVDAILGSWYWTPSGANYSINIMRGATDNDYNVTTSFSDDRGNHCINGQPDNYKVTKNADGSEILTFDKYAFRYDPEKKQISNPKPGKDFYVGSCIMLSDNGSMIFVKK